MSEWWTYKLSDFLLFSEHTYYRLFEIYNTDVWPIQLLTLLVGVFVSALLYWKPPWHGRAIVALLSACWLWVAWAYHWQHYATINWAARYFAAGFAVQAALFIWTGAIRNRLVIGTSNSFTHRAGLIVFLFALIVYPCLAPLTGRPWQQTEIFGVAPDPTSVVSLGILLLATDRVYWELLIIPLIWCVIGGAILWEMSSPEAFVLLLVGFLVAALAIWNTFWPSVSETNLRSLL